MIAARALFGGRGALRALVPGRRGAVQYVLRRGAYLRLGSEWVLLAAPDATFGPLSLAVSEPLGLAPGTEVSVSPDRRLVLGSHVISLDRTWVRRSTAVPIAAGGAPVSAETVRKLLPEPPTLLMGGLAALAGGRSSEAVRSLAGLGEGLTPAGDDVLAGYAGARVALGLDGLSLATLAAERSSPLGLAYLRCAEGGDLPDAGAGFLRAVCRGSTAAVTDAVARLREWGATSGISLGWGIAVAFINAQEVTDGPSRVQAGDLRIQGCGDRRLRRATRRVLGRPQI